MFLKLVYFLLFLVIILKILICTLVIDFFTNKGVKLGAIIMDFKDIWNKLFSYTPSLEYNFSISENSNNETQETVEKKSELVKIFPSISVNKEYMQTRYNTLINSDIVLREFTLNARGKQYHAFIVYIDGMVDSKIMDDFILKPLMLRNRRVFLCLLNKGLICQLPRNPRQFKLKE